MTGDNLTHTSDSAITESTIERAGVRLSAESAGEGFPVVLLHGLTATRRYVVMGSKALQRGGHRVTAYDARAHGRSSPAPSPDAYTYGELAEDLEAVLDQLEIERAVLAGASMGAHTVLSFALRAPDRVAGLVLITPAYDGEGVENPQRLQRWDALAEGLRSDGVDGFMAAYGEPRVGANWQSTVLKVVRQRLSAHEHPEALAEALRAVPRSRPFADVAALSAIAAPTAVVASNDDADPEHPQAVGEAYAQIIPGARLITDPAGSSPIAWQGSQLSRVIAEIAEQAVA
ncbi:MAG: alpha/beta hydrolase [Actinomycetota bacterium]|nr:alpha/beta hydrolase [Actinomycetota bacterium]